MHLDNKTIYLLPVTDTLFIFDETQQHAFLSPPRIPGPPPPPSPNLIQAVEGFPNNYSTKYSLPSAIFRMNNTSKQGKGNAKHAQRRSSLFRVTVPLSSGIRQVADNFFTTQFHYLEQENFIENSAHLRKIVAFTAFVLGKNNVYLVESALSKPPSMDLQTLSETSDNVSSKKPTKGTHSQARRGSLDMRRMKLIDTDANKDALPKGLPSM